MAAITTLAISGDVLSGSVWPGGVIPGPGDTTTFEDGFSYTHNTGATWRVGDSANPTVYAIRTKGTSGTALFDFTSPLELLGDVLQAANWTGGVGASVLFDHASTELRWQVSTANFQNKCLTLTGSHASPILVSSKSGGANGRFINGGFLDGGVVKGSQIDFLRIGTASNDALSININTPSANVRVDFTDVRFTSCGRVNLPQNVPANAYVRLQRVEFSAPLRGDRELFRISGNGGALGTGTRLIDNVSIVDGNMNVFGHHFSVNEFVVSSDTARVGLTIANPLSMTNCAERVNLSAGGGAIAFNVTPTQAPTIQNWYLGGFNDGNGRGAQFTLSSLAADMTLTRILTHNEYAADQGFGAILILQSDPAAARKVTVKQSIGLLNSGGYGNGDFIGPLGNFANLSIEVEHCTWAGDAGPKTGLNHGNAQTVAYRSGNPLYTSVKSNLIYDGARGASVLGSRYNNAVNQTDVIDPAATTHNWIQTQASGTVNSGTCDGFSWRSPATAAFFSTPPTGPTSTGDPRLVDKFRNAASWDLARGGAGTHSAAFARLAKRCSRSNPGALDTVQNMIEFVTVGFFPQNPATVAAHDGLNNGTIGAMPYLPTRKLMNNSPIGSLTSSRMAA